MSKQSFKVCFCFRRIFKFNALQPPVDVKQVFEQYSENGTMSLDNLHRFIIEFQGETDASKDDALAIFSSLKHFNIFQRKGLHLEAFFRCLLGDLNGPLSPNRGVHHDMTAPLSHYFLYTGHNSYLTGNQISSDSSVKPIIKALHKGVRVIELDLWPSSNNNNVEVRHGGTLTAPVDLLKCLYAIKEHAFQASEYPVVITFEDHLTKDLQSKVALMVDQTFGKMLFRHDSDQLTEFSSPESLKKKVMISTKPPEEYLETQKSKNKESWTRHISKKISKKEHLMGEKTASKKFSKKEHSEDEKTISKNELETDNKDGLDEGEHIPDEDEEKTVPEYRHLIAIHAGKVKGQDVLSIVPNKVRRTSMSEQELENAIKKHGTEKIVRFTQQNFLRVYPKGTRLDSSNYDPFIGWMHGAQMVAFNMQGYGKHLWIMQGMFRANGGCGYVKKPDFLLQSGPNNAVFDPHILSQSHIKKTLNVKIYMGEGWDLDFRRTHFDICSPPDFFVKVGIAGVPADKCKKQTKVIGDNWFPEWNEEFQFNLTVPELAVLRITVSEYDPARNHDFGGQTCLPIPELRTGIRAVPLHDRRGDKYKNVKLLMRFEIN